jgi:hypothetical protein
MILADTVDQTRTQCFERYLGSSPLRRILRIFGTTYRLTKQVRLAVAASENCAKKTASQNQEHLVAKKATKRTVRPYTKTEEKEIARSLKSEDAGREDCKIS